MEKLPILLCVFLLSACAPSEVPYDKLSARNGITYEINSQIPFTGVATVYYENGQLQHKGTFKNGETHGLAEAYHENGQLEARGTYKDGEAHGLVERYRWDGQEKFSPKCYQNGEEADISICKSL